MKPPANFSRALFCLVAVLLGAYFAWPSNERRIMRQYEKLLSEISKGGKESLANQALKKVSIAEVLGTEMVLQLGDPFPESINRDDFIRMMQYIRHEASFIEVKDRGATLRTSGNAYEMETTIEAEVKVANQSERFLGSYLLVWEKLDDRWVITSGAQINVIEHPAWSR